MRQLILKPTMEKLISEVLQLKTSLPIRMSALEESKRGSLLDRILIEKQFLNKQVAYFKQKLNEIISEVEQGDLDWAYLCIKHNELVREINHVEKTVNHLGCNFLFDDIIRRISLDEKELKSSSYKQNILKLFFYYQEFNGVTTILFRNHEIKHILPEKLTTATRRFIQFARQVMQTMDIHGISNNESNPENSSNILSYTSSMMFVFNNLLKITVILNFKIGLSDESAIFMQSLLEFTKIFTKTVQKFQDVMSALHLSNLAGEYTHIPSEVKLRSNLISSSFINNSQNHVESGLTITEVKQNVGRREVDLGNYLNSSSNLTSVFSSYITSNNSSSSSSSSNSSSGSFSSSTTDPKRYGF